MRALHAVEQAYTVNQRVQSFDGAGLHDGDHVVGAADGQQGAHLGNLAQRRLHRARELGAHGEHHVGRYLRLFIGISGARAVAGDDLVAFQPGDAGLHRRARQTDLARQQGHGATRVVAQLREQGLVYGVELHGVHPI
jgi:hypothetical protein